MSGDLLSWLPLLAKLAMTAGIVVAASVVAERAGPLIGALVATLPVTVWPAYVFLALDHDAAYVAAAARSGLAVNAVTGVFLLIYAVLAQSRGLSVCVGAAVGSWVVLALFARAVEWSLAAAGLLNLVVYPTCLWLGRAMNAAEMPPLRREWYDIPMRALLVCALMAALLEASTVTGPAVTGVIAVYPISSTSLMLILQPRIGGRAAAAVIANSLWGLFGISFGLTALGAGIVPYGAGPALAVALAIPVLWNLTVWMVRRSDTLASR